MQPLFQLESYKPAILKMADITASLYAKHQGIKPFVLCVRYALLAGASGILLRQT